MSFQHRKLEALCSQSSRHLSFAWYLWFIAVEFQYLDLVWSCVVLRCVTLCCVVSCRLDLFRVVLSFLGLAWFQLSLPLPSSCLFVSAWHKPCCYAFLLFDVGILISLSGMMLKLHLSITNKNMSAKRNTSILDYACILFPLVLLIIAYCFEGGEKGTDNGMLLALVLRRNVLEFSFLHFLFFECQF